MHEDNTNAETSQHNKWIEILLDTPLPDGRHRIVSHLLAPYLINVKHLEIEKAREIIEKWVEKCDAYELTRGNMKAFVERACYEANKLKRKPKDLKYFKEKNKQLYRMIVSVADSYGLEIERPIDPS